MPFSDTRRKISFAMSESIALPDEDPTRVVKDIVAGTAGGIAQVLVGQPFDTTKVRLQLAAPGTYSGPVDVAKQLIKNEGPRAFYKGTLTPLVGIGACVSVQFSVNQGMKRYYDGVNGGGSMSYGQFFTSGAAAGFANGFLVSPIEHVRIRLQTGAGGYHGPVDAILGILREGGVSGLMKGLVPTLARETVGAGMYFLTYEALVGKYCRENGVARSEVSPGRLCGYGACAGYAMWLSVYPVDVVKSKMQTDKLVGGKFGTMRKAAAAVWHEAGLRGFFRGFAPTLLRAAPANGATFAAFELTMRVLG